MTDESRAQAACRRVAVLYDIHANLPALDAVLERVADAGVDTIVIGGDVVPGPMPDEALDRLLGIDLPLHCIAGNGERAVLDVLAGLEPRGVPARARDAVEWTAAQLSAEHERWIAAWPATLSLPVQQLGQVLFCHATPRSDTEIFTTRTPDSVIAPAFDGVESAIVVCGHTHMPFERSLGALCIVNAGSVGMPFGLPGAAWLLLGPEVSPVHTPYDLVHAADDVRQTRYPQAEEFAARNIMAPPTIDEMLVALAAAEMR